jgi:hypothetical protein
MGKVYRLGLETFATKGLALARISEILNAGPLESEVTGRDTLILYDLLALRTDKQAELQGREVIGFIRGTQPGKFDRTRCFWALLDKDGRLHFSVYKAVQLLKFTG